jgi:zinc resistance-associated protein
MERALLRMLAAAAAAAALSASGFTITAAAQSDAAAAPSDAAAAPSGEQPTHAEQVQHWAEVGIDTQLKGLKTSLRLTADQEKDWGSFESAVKDAQKARVVALQKEQATNLSPMDRNTAKAERLEQSQADLEKVVEAAKPLYASLDGAQKQKFIALGRLLVPERGQFAKEIRRLGLGKSD